MVIHTATDSDKDTIDAKTQFIVDCARETFKPPFDKYAKYGGSFGFTTLGTMKKNGFKVELKEGETLEDECLHFSLAYDTPPEAVEELSAHRQTYNGVRVFFDKLDGPPRFF